MQVVINIFEYNFLLKLGLFQILPENVECLDSLCCNSYKNTRIFSGGYTGVTLYGDIPFQWAPFSTWLSSKSQVMDSEKSSKRSHFINFYRVEQMTLPLDNIHATSDTTNWDKKPKRQGNLDQTVIWFMFQCWPICLCSLNRGLRQLWKQLAIYSGLVQATE